MKESDYADLKAIAEKLAVVAISDANPDHWFAAGVKPSDMSPEQRAEAYWSRKLASQTLSVLTKVMSVTGMIERATRDGEPPEGSPAAESQSKFLDSEIDAARRKATRMLKLVHSRNNGKG